MKVSSPIGDLPFEPRSMRFSRRGIELDGVMGAWPAKVEIDGSDIPALVRVTAKPLAFAAAAGLAAFILIRSRTK